MKDNNEDINQIVLERDIYKEVLLKIASRTMAMGYTSTSDLARDLKRIAIDTLEND